jgi:hypothetical protein
MDRRVRASISIAPPLAAVAVACALLPAPSPQRVALAPASVEHCRRAAELLHDVHWATACAAHGDTGEDCMLPHAQAARVNALLATEESRCLAVEARQNIVSW